MLKLLAAPTTNIRSPRYMERALAAIHQALHDHGELTLSYASHDDQVGLYLTFPDAGEELIAGPIAANYPNCELKTVERFDDAPGWQTWTATLTLRPEIYCIMRHAQFEDLLNGNFADPVSGILRAVMPGEGIRCSVAIRIRPASRRRQRLAQEALRLLDRTFFRHRHRLAEWYADQCTRHPWRAWPLGLFARQSPPPSHTSLDTSGSRLHDREQDLQAASSKIGGQLFEAQIQLTSYAPRHMRALALNRLRQMAGAFGAFTQSRLATFQCGRIREGSPDERAWEGSLLSHEELATLFHPPTATAAAEHMQMLEFRELEPPPQFRSGQEPDAVTLGRVLFREDHRTVGIDADARRRHLYVIGSTGAGKSTLLLNLIHQDMRVGRGLTLIDVHGDLAESVIDRVPKHRTNDAILFDAAAEQVIAFNPLACSDPKYVDQVTSGVVSAFKKLYDSWGPRLENLLRYTAFVAVEQHGTLLDMLRLLTDRAFRDQLVGRVADGVVRSFWQDEFVTWSKAYRTEAVSSVTNKLMPFLTSRQLRAITTSSKQSLDIREVMDAGKLLIINLSRGQIGQDNSTLLGSLLLTAIEQTALSRADIPEEQRRDHYLYLDEFQSLVTPSTAIMLSESRKYRLCLTLSHQLTRQLDPDTYHSVIGNCGTLLSFRVGLEDAELLAPAMSKHPGQLLPSDLCNLPNFTAYVRLLIAGHPSRPFSLRTLPPVAIASDENRGDIVRRTSQRRNPSLAMAGPSLND